jgi:hypothetical protein
MLCILIVCLYFCNALYPDRLFVLFYDVVSWSSVYTVWYKTLQQYRETIKIQNVTTVQTDDQDTKHNNSINRRSILIICLHCCYALYLDRLLVLLLCFVCWSSVYTVVRFWIPIVCYTKRNNSTNRRSRYKTQQQYKQTIRIQNITTVLTDNQDTKHNNSTNRWSGYKLWSSISTVVMLCILIVC